MALRILSLLNAMLVGPCCRCLVALERLLQHPDAKYVSSTAEALRHGWTDLEVYAERPVHLGPIVQELRQGAAVGWSQQGYMSAAQVGHCRRALAHHVGYDVQVCMQMWLRILLSTGRSMSILLALGAVCARA